MKRSFMLAAALFSAAPCALPQAGTREAPPLYRGPMSELSGVFVTPVAGIPFTATVDISSEQKLTDGSTSVKHTEVFIARDSGGRIRNERRALVTEAFRGTPPLLGVHIFDPATRISSLYTPGTGIVKQMVLPPATAGEPSYPGAKELGYTTLNGMQAKGVQVTRRVPAESSGTGKPVEVTDEFWYSEELHMNLLERHVDPRSGEQTVAILAIKRAEPPAELFALPAGYKVVDMTPPPLPAPESRGAQVTAGR